MTTPSKPREFWIRQGRSHLDRDEIYTSDIQEADLIHVIEYEEYQDALAAASIHAEEHRKERARNTRLVAALDTLRRHHHGDGSVTRGEVYQVLAEKAEGDTNG
jgi:hypothetical protein